jgi:hypothetical protein
MPSKAILMSKRGSLAGLISIASRLQLGPATPTATSAFKGSWTWLKLEWQVIPDGYHRAFHFVSFTEIMMSLIVV